MITLAHLAPQLSAVPQQGSKTPQNPKLVNAAHEFEASMMQELLKPLQQDSLFSESGDASGSDQGGGSADALMSFGSEAMAKALSEQGGFGIATGILKHFHDAATHAEAKNPGKAVS